MTTEENVRLIRGSVEEIKKSVSDYEGAHGQEDYLWESVLKDIANGAPDPAILANEALKTKEIEFPRYCA